jgi:hypothetical protein
MISLRKPGCSMRPASARVPTRRHDPWLLILTDTTGKTKSLATETITASQRGDNDGKEAVGSVPEKVSKVASADIR